MSLPVAILIHTCTPILQRESGDTDQYGNPTFTETTLEPKKCRFSGQVANLGANGYYSTARCTLAPTTEIQENDLIKTTTPGFEKEYWVNSVRQVYEASSNRISHTILDLREIEGAT